MIYPKHRTLIVVLGVLSFINIHISTAQAQSSQDSGGNPQAVTEELNRLESYFQETDVQIEAEQLKPAIVLPSAIHKRTHSFDMSVDAYYYRYSEPSIDVFLRGAMAGFYGNYTYRAPKDSWLNNSSLNFYRVEGHIAQGKLDYQGSGEDKGIKNKMYELRALVGKETKLSDGSRVTPYFGFGYRYLIDPQGGRLTDQGFFGYDRKSHYFYIPLGATVDIPTKNDMELSLNLEYDWFLQGSQKSYLSDGNQFNPNAPSFDVSNHQKHGYGIRGSIRILKHMQPLDVYMEPFFRLWNIEDSKIVRTVSTGSVAQVLEPQNTTMELGSKFGVQF